MRLTYIVLSPSFGMNQYTADLANHGTVLPESGESTAHICAIISRAARLDRFGSHVAVRPVVDTQGAGLTLGNLNPVALRQVSRAIIQSHPDMVHFTGPHVWNPILLWLMRRAKIPTVHTIHDLDPHSGSSYGRLLYVWNNSIQRLADHILVHSQAYRARLIARGLSADRVTAVPLLHLFMSYELEQSLQGRASWEPARTVTAPKPFALFFARLEAYKGVDVLIEAMRELDGHSPVRAVIAGKGDIQRYVGGGLPGNVEVRNYQIDDLEAIELFSACSVVVLPYLDATQSALIAAAYFFDKPVIVTRTGALPEYVLTEETGWIIEPRDAQALAARLQMALDDPVRLNRMGHAGHSWYEAQRRLERSALCSMYDTVGCKRNMRDGKAASFHGG